MKVPTSEQINFIKEIILKGLLQLIINDSDIFNMDNHVESDQDISERNKVLNRELHEICINHRLAHYFENQLYDTDYKDYFVDIEYNRNYEDKKILNTENGPISVRPDIVIHSRMNNNINPQHLLVVESKKYEISEHDIRKIKGFISDSKYYYLFGLTISYCSFNAEISAKLYYSNGTEIINEKINVEK